MAATSTATSDHLVGTLRDTIVSLVRRDGPDLSARQLGVFLTCYLHEGGHTVRGLAAILTSPSPPLRARSIGWASWIWHVARSIRWIAAACSCSVP